MYKSSLQELCHGKKWALPSYTSMKDGPDHIPEFKASVVVNGLSFDSPASCKSSKDAHNHAAMLAFLHFTSSSDCSTWNAEPKIEVPKKEETNQGAEVQSDTTSYINDFVAEYANRSKLPKEEKDAAAAKAGLMSWSPDSFQKDESGLYKNLLQELTKRECLCMPVYRTTKSAAHHTPTFFSSVEVEGAMFYGIAGKSVKQAEHSAAMIAYKSLKEGGFTQVDEFTFPNLNENAAKATSSSKLAVKDEIILIPYPNFTSQGHSKVKKETDSAEKLQAHVKLTSNEECNSISATMKKEENETVNAGNGFSIPESKPSPGGQLLMSPRSTHPNLSGILDTRNVRNTTGTRSYLLCNKVRVYTEFPDFTFPKGVTVLPIAEDKWVAISLEFPNEERHPDVRIVTKGAFSDNRCRSTVTKNIFSDNPDVRISGQEKVSV